MALASSSSGDVVDSGAFCDIDAFSLFVRGFVILHLFSLLLREGCGGRRAGKGVAG